MTQTFVNSMPTLRQKDIRDSLFPLYVVAVYIGKRSPGCGMSTDSGRCYVFAACYSNKHQSGRNGRFLQKITL